MNKDASFRPSFKVFIDYIVEISCVPEMKKIIASSFFEQHNSWGNIKNDLQLIATDGKNLIKVNRYSKY